jgi:hypothetical protein
LVEVTFFLADEADGALPEELEAKRSGEDGADLGEEQEQQFHQLEETAQPLPESSQPPREPRSSAYSGRYPCLLACTFQRCFSSSGPAGPSGYGSLIIFNKRRSGQGKIFISFGFENTRYILNTECKKYIIFRLKSTTSIIVQLFTVYVNFQTKIESEDQKDSDLIIWITDLWIRISTEDFWIQANG